jgi:hypothetical protein
MKQLLTTIAFGGKQWTYCAAVCVPPNHVIYFLGSRTEIISLCNLTFGKRSRRAGNDVEREILTLIM